MQEEDFDYKQELYLDVAHILSGNSSEESSEKVKRELIKNIKGFRKLRLKGLAKIVGDTALFGAFIVGASSLGYAFKDESVRNTVSIVATFWTSMLGSGLYMKDLILNTMRAIYANQKIKECKRKLSDYVDVDYEIANIPLVK